MKNKILKFICSLVFFRMTEYHRALFISSLSLHQPSFLHSTTNSMSFYVRIKERQSEKIYLNKAGWKIFFLFFSLSFTKKYVERNKMGVSRYNLLLHGDGWETCHSRCVQEHAHTTTCMWIKKKKKKHRLVAMLVSFLLHDMQSN